MKNFWIGMLALMLGFCVVSCKENPNKDDKAKAESEQVEEKVDLADIVAKAKAEGAKWSADEWKEQYKAAMNAYKPFAVAMDKAQPADLEGVIKKYADVPSLMEEFAKIAKQAEGGKGISDEWVKTTMEELGIPEI